MQLNEEDVFFHPLTILTQNNQGEQTKHLPRQPKSQNWWYIFFKFSFKEFIVTLLCCFMFSVKRHDKAPCQMQNNAKRQHIWELFGPDCSTEHQFLL